MFDGIIFDLDGTLLNTIDDLAAAGNYTLKKLGHNLHETEKYKMFVGNGIPKLIRRMMPPESTDEEIEEAFIIFSGYYELHKDDYAKPYEGLTELVANLHRDGIKTAVATNKAHKFSCELVSEFYGNNIDIVIGQQDSFPRKPDPAIVNYIIEKFSLPRSKVLYVGDSGVDMVTAKNAGLISCGVLWGFRSRGELVENGAIYLAENSQMLKMIIENS